MSNKETYSNQLSYIQEKIQQLPRTKTKPLTKLLKQAEKYKQDTMGVCIRNKKLSFCYPYGDHAGYRPLFVDQDGEVWIGKSSRHKQDEYISDFYGLKICQAFNLNTPEVRYRKIGSTYFHISAYIQGATPLKFKKAVQVGYFIKQKNLTDKMQAAMFPRLLLSEIPIQNRNRETEDFLQFIKLDINPTNFLLKKDKLYQIDFSTLSPGYALDVVSNLVQYGCTFDKDNPILKQQLDTIKQNPDLIQNIIEETESEFVTLATNKTFKLGGDKIVQNLIKNSRSPFIWTYENLDSVIDKLHEFEIQIKPSVEKEYQKFLEQIPTGARKLFLNLGKWMYEKS